jgi:hypothetical protein
VTGFLLAVIGVAGTLGMTAIGDMVSEEIRGRLDHLPHAILRLAAKRLDDAQRAALYEDQWLPELIFILKGDEARPLTRLYHGTRTDLGAMLGALDALAAIEAEARQIEADFPGWHVWLSSIDRWWAVRQGPDARWGSGGDRRPMTLDADDAAGLRALLAQMPAPPAESA